MAVSTNCLGLWLIRFASGASGRRGFAAIYSLVVVCSILSHFILCAYLPFVGSIQSIVGIPDDIKAVYRTAFEIDPRALIDMAVSRSPFVDQSQSLSLFVAQPTPPLLVCRRFLFYLNAPEFTCCRWISNFMHGEQGLRLARTTCGASRRPTLSLLA